MGMAKSKDDLIIEQLQRDNKELREENERVRQANIHTMAVFEDMKAAKEKAEARVAELEQAEARVAELAAKAHNLSFGIVNSLTDGQQEPFAKQFAELQDCIAAQSSEPYVLRKQAEAVEAAKHEHALTARIPDGTAGEHFQDGFDAAAEQYDASLDRYAQRLRQQADEAERAGGEK